MLLVTFKKAVLEFNQMFPIVQEPSSEVLLLTSAQDSFLDNRLEQDTRMPSIRLHSVVEHLMLVTTPLRMPKGDVLIGLWRLLQKPQVSMLLPRSLVIIGHFPYFLFADLTN